MFFLPICSLAFALKFTAWLQIPKRIGDISYGTYIYAFPVQQALILSGVQHVIPLIIASLLISWVMGYLSFNWVEKPFLKR